MALLSASNRREVARRTRWVRPRNPRLSRGARARPRPSMLALAPLGPTTPWTAAQTGHFIGYALWTYLLEPYIFQWPGVATSELDEWNEVGESWRRLQVTFPNRCSPMSAPTSTISTRGPVCNAEWTTHPRSRKAAARGALYFRASLFRQHTCAVSASRVDPGRQWTRGPSFLADPAHVHAFAMNP